MAGAAGRTLWAWRLLEAAAAVQGLSVMQLCTAAAGPATSGACAGAAEQPAAELGTVSGSTQQQSAAANQSLKYAGEF